MNNAFQETKGYFKRAKCNVPQHTSEPMRRLSMSGLRLLVRRSQALHSNLTGGTARDFMNYRQLKNGKASSRTPGLFARDLNLKGP